MSIDQLKNDVKHLALRGIGARRAHIVGCERSGTSMLTYAMVAFDKTVVYDKETAVWNYPSFAESLGLYFDRRLRASSPLIVTKRNAAWWRPDRIERLITFARRYRIFIINLIRDPRDVLTSKHPLDKRRFYVEPQLWVDEMDATERLMAGLDGYDLKMTVRYEDIMLSPDAVQSEFCRTFGFGLRDGIESWKNLRSNVKARGDISHMIPYMHELRDFDPGTIGKWRHDPDARQHVDRLLADASFKDRLRDFMQHHRYE